jgi:hypothetical protein
MNGPLRRWRWGTCVMAAVVAVVSGEKLFDCWKRPNGGTIIFLRSVFPGVDNGRIVFDHVRVPRDNLLNNYGDVARDGTYTSPIENPNRRFFTMLGTMLLHGGDASRLLTAGVHRRAARLSQNRTFLGRVPTRSNGRTGALEIPRGRPSPA